MKRYGGSNMISEGLTMHRTVKERVIETVKDLLGWAVVTAVAFAWWMAMLLIFSLILVNVWKTTFEAILQYSLILMSVTSLVYLVRIVYKRVKVK